jgi:hypothetical protein
MLYNEKGRDTLIYNAKGVKNKQRRWEEREKQTDRGLKKKGKDVVELCIMLYNEKGRDMLIYKLKGEKDK